MSKPKLLFIVQEITPYLAESEMSLLGRNLPQTAQENGFEVRTFMPKYGIINERRNQLHEVIRLSGLNLIINDTDHPLIIKVATLQSARMQVYFIDNDDYFQRHGAKDLEIYDTPEDNDERIMFFARGVIETVKKLRWEPTLIQTIGWVSSLAPLYIRHVYNDDPMFAATKNIYAISKTEPNIKISPTFVDKLRADGFTDEDLKPLIQAGDNITDTDLQKLAIMHSDALVQTSPDVDPALIQLAVESGKPFMPYSSDETFIADCAEFYKTL